MLDKPTYRVAVILDEPCVSLRNNWQALSGNDRFQGFCVDIMHELSTNCGFNYNLTVATDPTYGAPIDHLGNWSGVIGQILQGNADIGAAAFTITAERHAVIKFTEPFMNYGLGILIKRPQRLPPSLLTFLGPFSGTLWAGIITAAVVVTIFMWIISLLSRGAQCTINDKHTSSYTDYFWHTIAVLLNQGTNFDATQLALRVVMMFWWFFCLIIVSSYTANLAALFTVAQYESSINSYEDLAQQSSVEYGIVAHTSTASFFKKATIQPYQRMWNHMSRVDNVSDGYQRVVQGNYAFISHRPGLEYYAAWDCNVIVVGEEINKAGFGFVLRNNFPQEGAVDLEILRMLEDSRMAEMHRKWFRRNSDGTKHCKNERDSAALDFSHLRGIFMFLSCGLGMGLLIAGFQKLYSHVTNREDSAISTP